MNEIIICPSCKSDKVKKNGHIHNGKQRYKCLLSSCSRQFVLNPTQKLISLHDKERIKKMLVERISLKGICRVMDVSMPWLLGFVKKVYSETPDDLNIVINPDAVEGYKEDLFSDEIYDLLEKKKF